MALIPTTDAQEEEEDEEEKEEEKEEEEGEAQADCRNGAWRGARVASRDGRRSRLALVLFRVAATGSRKEEEEEEEEEEKTHLRSRTTCVVA